MPTPAFSLATGPISAVLGQGHTTTFAISAQPIGGYSGAPTLSTLNLPTGVTASFSPAKLSSDGG